MEPVLGMNGAGMVSASSTEIAPTGGSGMVSASSTEVVRTDAPGMVSATRTGEGSPDPLYAAPGLIPVPTHPQIAGMDMAREESRRRRIVALTVTLVQELMAEATDPAQSAGLQARALLLAQRTLGNGRAMVAAVTTSTDLKRSKRLGMPNAYQGQGGVDFEASDDIGGLEMPPEMGVSPMGGNLLTGQMAETFGSVTLTEIVTNGKRLVDAFSAVLGRVSTAQTMKALVDARAAGLDDLAKELEDKLRKDLGMPEVEEDLETTEAGAA